MSVDDANRCRFDPMRPGGHVESYFWRANDPRLPRALWLKATILAPLAAPPCAEVWAVMFDASKDRVFAHKATVPFARAVFDDAGTIRIADCTFYWGATGSAHGALANLDGACHWHLRWSPVPGAVGDPLLLLPLAALLDAPFPRSKLITPLPALTFEGTVTCFGETIDVSGWHGMQGHNWGREHAYEYAWGQCLFPETGETTAVVEGFTARIKIGGLRSPRLSCLHVRRGINHWAFDTLVDVWRQSAELASRRWRLSLRGKDGKATLEMDATGRPIACLGYTNPDGHTSYCFNSKLARTVVRVEPSTGAPFELHSDHGGALEFLRAEPEAGIAVV